MQRNRAVLKLFLSAFVASAAVPAVMGQTNDSPQAVQTSASPSQAARPAKWAVKLNWPHLSNFYRVTTNLYRGAQPDAFGMAQLKVMGIRTVVNLRSFHSDKDEVRGLGLQTQRLRMKPWHSEDEDVVGFLKIVAKTNNYPIFVHCMRGADRTGLVCAMYRVVFEGWTKEDAIEEMKEGGFDYDTRWKNIVKYIEQADIESLKKQAGIAPSTPPDSKSLDQKSSEL